MLIKRNSKESNRLESLQDKLDSGIQTPLTLRLKKFVKALVVSTVNLDWTEHGSGVYDTRYRGYILTVEHCFKKYELSILNTDFSKSKEIFVKGGLPSIGSCERIGIAIIDEIENVR
jgi:hypothetical protein